MFCSAEANLCLTYFRAYDAELGRWLSRDPLENAEVLQGPNLYGYTANDPVNRTDPLGLLWGKLMTDGDWEQFSRVFGLGEVQEVLEEVVEEDFVLRQIPASQVRPGGEIMVRPKGELMLRPKLEVEPWTPRFRQPYPAPRVRTRPLAPRVSRPIPMRTYVGFSGALNEFFGAGITILTMTDCNTVEGILALARVSKGGLLNKYEDRMMKQLKEMEHWQ